MKVMKYRDLTPELVEKFANVLSATFQRNEFVYCYLMGENIKVLQQHMEIVVSYNNHFADYYALVKDNGEWAAVAVCLPADCVPLSLGSMLKRGKLPQLLRLIITPPLKYAIRMIKFTDLEDKHWLKEPFVTLDMLGSLEKGCGTAILKETLKAYSDQTVALNSSVTKGDHSYYQQFGFVPYADLQMDNYKTVMMVKRP